MNQVTLSRRAEKPSEFAPGPRGHALISRLRGISARVFLKRSAGAAIPHVRQLKTVLRDFEMKYR
jgi:hypothetical protein